MNLGEFLNEHILENNKKEIISVSKDIKGLFESAYRYLGAAKLVHDQWSFYNNSILNISKINKLQRKLITDIFNNNFKENIGVSRHLFATALTPDGIITFIDTLFNDYDNVYILNGAPGTKKSSILNSIYKESVHRGYYTEVLHNPLIPSNIEHVIIPELNTAILTSNELSNKKFKGNEFFMSDFQFRNKLNNSREELKQAKLNFYTLLNEGLHFLGKAKKTHDIIENYYIPNVDFNSVNLLYEKTMREFLDYEKDYLNI